MGRKGDGKGLKGWADPIKKVTANTGKGMEGPKASSLIYTSFTPFSEIGMWANLLS